MMAQDFDRLSSWFLIVFGSLLLVVGALGLAVALINHDWTESLFTVALLVIVVLGIRRGLRRLTGQGRGRGRRHE